MDEISKGLMIALALFAELISLFLLFEFPTLFSISTLILVVVLVMIAIIDEIKYKDLKHIGKNCNKLWLHNCYIEYVGQFPTKTVNLLKLDSKLLYDLSIRLQHLGGASDIKIDYYHDVDREKLIFIKGNNAIVYRQKEIV